MFTRSILLTALAVSLYSFISAGCSGTKTRPERPQEALAVAIKLSEAHDRTGVVKRSAPPAVLEKMKQQFGTDDIDRIANTLVGDRTQDMLRNLYLVKDTKPVFNDKRTQATFSAQGVDGKAVVVRFTLIDGKWYGGT